MFDLRIPYNKREVQKLADRKTVDYGHLRQDCIDELGLQEFVEGPWDVETCQL